MATLILECVVTMTLYNFRTGSARPAAVDYFHINGDPVVDRASKVPVPFVIPGYLIGIERVGVSAQSGGDRAT